MKALLLLLLIVTACTPVQNETVLPSLNGTLPIYLGVSTTEGGVGYNLTTGGRDFEQPLWQGRDTVYLGGMWNVHPDRMVAVNRSALTVHYEGTQVLVAAAGRGVIGGEFDREPFTPVMVSGPGWYSIVNHTHGKHSIDLFVAPGVELFTLKFS